MAIEQVQLVVLLLKRTKDSFKFSCELEPIDNSHFVILVINCYVCIVGKRHLLLGAETSPRVYSVSPRPH